MTASRPFLSAAVAAFALGAVVLATAGEASARGRHGGPAGGVHLGHHRHHLHIQQFRQHRHHRQRHFFTRFTPCAVWTRQGWTNLCTGSR